MSEKAMKPKPQSEEAKKAGRNQRVTRQESGAPSKVVRMRGWRMRAIPEVSCEAPTASPQNMRGILVCADLYFISQLITLGECNPYSLYLFIFLPTLDDLSGSQTKHHIGMPSFYPFSLYLR